ncbi:hypothetical protein PR048_018296 [Dryococelus australis]|uniref:Uncharacterized protein n=1 Tax=Dryococelus australis TaxID=614101 RepID=A0ABQ9HC10_9NEOP|nr:hypothetical protein PR048_018296 [Dryococelus australis]
MAECQDTHKLSEDVIHAVQGSCHMQCREMRPSKRAVQGKRQPAKVNNSQTCLYCGRSHQRGCMEQHDDEDIMYPIQGVCLSREVNQLQADTNKNSKKLYTTLHFPTAVVCQIECGATCNLMSIQDLQRVIGEADSHRLIPGKNTENDIRQEFKDTLQGLGQKPGEVQLDVKVDTKPQQDPPYCVPIPLKKELKILLQQPEQQRKLQEALGNLPEVKIVADDVLVYGQGKTEKEALINYDENLLRLFQRAREKDIKFNPRFFNYLTKFLPHLATVGEPIRQLTHKDVLWHWGHRQDHALTEIKKLATSAPVLQYYDVEVPVVIQ